MTDRSEYVYDNHTLQISCDCATREQIASAIDAALNQYESQHSKLVDRRFFVNLVTDRYGKSFGFAYVFFPNSAIYHMLLGHNEDGSERIELIDDPSWEKPSDGQIPSFDDDNDEEMDYNQPSFIWDQPDAMDSSGDWAAIISEKDNKEQQRQAELAKYQQPQIRVSLEPLMVLDPFELTPLQAEKKRQDIIDRNKEDEEFDANKITVAPEAYFQVDRAMCKPVDDKFMHNVLRCRGVPRHIKERDLKIAFSPYASDITTSHERRVRGQVVTETYPIININNERTAFIIFDPETNDARFALHMMKKVEFTNPDSMLLFSHSFRSDRDAVSAIVKRHRKQNLPRSEPNAARTRSSPSCPGSAPIMRPGPGSNMFDALMSMDD